MRCFIPKAELAEALRGFAGTQDCQGSLIRLLVVLFDTLSDEGIRLLCDGYDLSEIIEPERFRVFPRSARISVRASEADAVERLLLTAHLYLSAEDARGNIVDSEHF